MGTLLVSVAGGLIVAAVMGAWRWLTAADNREAVKQAVRRRLCRHEWEAINKPGDSLVLITPDAEWCVKRGARR